MIPAAREVLIALADDEMCMGQRHAGWIGTGPFLEEDLAFISIAQDELAHARALYRLLATHDEPSLDGDELERAADHWAMGRAPAEHRCCWLVEDRCAAWEDAFVRHVLYDEAETVRWQALEQSTVGGLAGLATRILVEEEYHRRHAHPMLVRLATGTAESRRRIEASLARLLPLARSLFEPTDDEAVAVAHGVIDAASTVLEQRWHERLAQLWARAGLVTEWPEPAGFGGRRGVRSPAFDALHAEMSAVYALDPRARW